MTIGPLDFRRRLTDDIILKIKQLFTSGFKQIEIAAHLGISQSSVHRVLTGKIGADVGGPITPPPRPTLQLSSGEPENEEKALKVEEIYDDAIEKELKRLGLENQDGEEKDSDAKLRAAVKVRTAQKSGVPFDPFKDRPRLSWDIIVDTAPQHGAVQLGMADPAIRDAISLAFGTIDQEHWDTEVADDLIRDICNVQGVHYPSSRVCGIKVRSTKKEKKK